MHDSNDVFSDSQLNYCLNTGEVICSVDPFCFPMATRLHSVLVAQIGVAYVKNCHRRFRHGKFLDNIVFIVQSAVSGQKCTRSLVGG